MFWHVQRGKRASRYRDKMQEPELRDTRTRMVGLRTPA